MSFPRRYIALSVPKEGTGSTGRSAHSGNCGTATSRPMRAGCRSRPRAFSRSRPQSKCARMPALDSQMPVATHATSLLDRVDPRTIVLVEGVSDQRALEALAERRGRNLDAEGISIVPIGGAQAIGSFLERFGPQGLDVRLAGLCDVGRGEPFPARSRTGRPRLEPHSRRDGIARLLRVRCRPGG